MQETALAYMAGLFDGEGCVTIVKRKPIKPNGVTPSYWIRISIQITDKWACRLFESNFGGKVEISRKPTSTYFTCYRWVVDGENCVVILESLLPYLHLKKSQAELAIKFQKGKHHGGWGRIDRKPEEYSTLEESDYLLMRSLKKEKML